MGTPTGTAFQHLTCRTLDNMNGWKFPSWQQFRCAWSTFNHNKLPVRFSMGFYIIYLQENVQIRVIRNKYKFDCCNFFEILQKSCRYLSSFIARKNRKFQPLIKWRQTVCKFTLFTTRNKINSKSIYKREKWLCLQGIVEIYISINID